MSHNSPFDEHIDRDPGQSPAESAPSLRGRTDPRCGHCGYDRSGIPVDDACPGCSKFQSAPKCTYCGYELFGLQVSDCCPECGKPIWDSNVTPPTSGLAIASLVIGIVSMMSCIIYGVPSIILGPLAIIFGEISIRQYKKGLRAGSTKGFSWAGRICGWISLTVGLVFIGLMIFMIINA